MALTGNEMLGHIPRTDGNDISLIQPSESKAEIGVIDKQNERGEGQGNEGRSQSGVTWCAPRDTSSTPIRHTFPLPLRAEFLKVVGSVELLALPKQGRFAQWMKTFLEETSTL